MTTNYHTPITPGAAADAATVNAPLEELDAAIGSIDTSGGVGGSYYAVWPESPSENVLVSTIKPYDAQDGADVNFSSNTALINGNSFSLLVQVSKSIRYSLSYRFGSTGPPITQILDAEKFTFYARVGLAFNRTDINGDSKIYGYFGHTVEGLFTTDNVIEYWAAGTIQLHTAFDLPAGQTLTAQPIYNWIESKLAWRRINTQNNPVTSEAAGSSTNFRLQLTAANGSIIYTRKLP